MANKTIDLEDLIPAQVAGTMFLIQFGIVELVAYDGAFDLHKSYEIAAGYTISLAFVVSAIALGAILFTNHVTMDDVSFWDDGGSLDAVYSFAIAATIGLLVAVEFWEYAADLITTSDMLGTAAFLVSVVAIWSVVWIK